MPSESPALEAKTLYNSTAATHRSPDGKSGGGVEPASPFSCDKSCSTGSLGPMTTGSFPLWLGLSMLLVASACSVGSYAGSDAGGADDKKLTDLTDAERGQLCDFAAGLNGGYGHTTREVCDGGRTSERTAQPDQATCVNGLSTVLPAGCPVTLSEAKACFSALATSSCTSAPGNIPASCSRLVQPVCGGSVTVTGGDAGGSEAGGPSSKCSRSSLCTNGACRCSAGPKKDSSCQREDPAASDSCETLCYFCE